MSTMPMQQPDDGDPGDEQGSYAQCEKEIEDLEARVSAIEKQMGIKQDADEPEPDPLASAIQGNANPFLKAKSL